MPPIDQPLPPEGPQAGPGAVVGGAVVVIAGGSAAAASTTSNTAAYLTFAAAILVALITWYATDRRQRSALVADERRLVRQLVHDKELSDRQELRAFLDQIAAAYDELHSDYTRLMVLFRRSWDQSLTPKQDADVRRLLSDADRAVAGGIPSMSRLGRRLGLRFPTSDPAFETLLEALGEINEGYSVYSNTQQDPVKRANAMAQHGQNGLTSFKRFSDAVRAALEPAAIANR